MSTDPGNMDPFDTAARAAAPSWLLSLFEGPRALTEAGSLLPAHAFLRRLPPGDGHAVMTVPGFMATDRSMQVLRNYLAQWNYDPHCWALGRNYGVLENGDLADALDARLAAIASQAARPVSLIGWSLGGLLAREAARRNPELVRCVITLGSPLGDPKATNAWRLFEMLTGRRISDASIQRRIERVREPVPGVPTTALYSRSDAIVAAEIAQLPPGDEVESIELSSASHLGMGFNPLVLYLIADRLRQPEGAWRPFEYSGLRNLFFH